MQASFQPLDATGAQVGPLRVHPGGGRWEEYSDYAFCCTMLVKDNEAWLYATERGPTIQEFRAIKKMLIGMGVTAAHYEHKGKFVTIYS